MVEIRPVKRSTLRRKFTVRVQRLRVEAASRALGRKLSQRDIRRMNAQTKALVHVFRVAEAKMDKTKDKKEWERLRAIGNNAKIELRKRLGVNVSIWGEVAKESYEHGGP